MKRVMAALLAFSMLLVPLSVSSEVSSPRTEEVKQLKLSKDDKMILGVCGGLGEYFGIDSDWFRVGFVAAVLLGGAGIGGYLVFWFFMR